MIARLASLALIPISAMLFTSCGTSSDVKVLSKSSIRSSSGGAGLAKKDSFPQIGKPSAATMAAATSKQKDRHKMPVYAFSDRTRLVRTTAYTCTESDHIIYGNRNATGTQLRYTNRVRSAAADWSFYPVGSVFRITGLPYLYVVDDYGSALTGTGTIDIYKPSKEIMDQWGRRNVEITIVQWGSFNRSAEILAQRRQYPHCNQMLTNIVRQRPDLSAVAKR